jgi:hypothetical protein
MLITAAEYDSGYYVPGMISEKPWEGIPLHHRRSRSSSAYQAATVSRVTRVAEIAEANEVAVAGG